MVAKQTAAMEPVLTRLDPTFPICWEDPDTLRVGFEHAVARVRNPTVGMQRFVGVLRRGVDASRLPDEARRAGVTLGEARSALAQLEPALIVDTAAASVEAAPLTARMCTGGRRPEALREALVESGVCRFPSDEQASDPAEIDLVIFVERYWEPLERAQGWLMDGVPHLLVRFTDNAVHVGPIVRAHGRPCHTCVSLVRVERDPATAALAAQLAGRPVASERRDTSVLAAAHAAWFIRAWRADDSAAHRTRIVLPVSRAYSVATPRVEQVVPHPECACGPVTIDDDALRSGRDHPRFADES